MKATIRDTLNSLTPKNLLVIAVIVTVMVIGLHAFGYLIMRRFPEPIEIIVVAVIMWKTGRIIGHPGLERLLNAGSMGLGTFGVMIWISAAIDGYWFPGEGYFSVTTKSTMWGWIIYYAAKALRILAHMPRDRRMHVTEDTAGIYAQMTYREARIGEALAKNEEVDRQLNLDFAAL
jgi:hypothetical protein